MLLLAVRLQTGIPLVVSLLFQICLFVVVVLVVGVASIRKIVNIL